MVRPGSSAVHRGVLLRAYLPFIASLVSNQPLIAAADLDRPGELLEFIRRHTIGPAVAFLVEGTPLERELPPRVRTALADARASQARRSGALVARLQLIASALDGAHIDWTLLKGPGLALRFYGGLDRRFMRDLDILVTPGDLPRSERVMAELGYHRASWAPVRRLALRWTHAFDYVDGDAIVDLHWTPASHPSFRFDVEAMRARRQTLTLNALRARIPSDEDALSLYLVSAFSDLQRSAFSARALIDLHRMAAALEPCADWETFLQHRRDEGAYAIAVSVLDFVLDTMGAHEALPRLAAALRRAGAGARGRRACTEMLTPSRFSVGNKLWALGLYETPRLQSIGWWAASLPVRYLVHRGWRRPPRLR